MKTIQLKLEIDDNDVPIDIQEYRGREALNEPFEWDLLVVAKGAHLAVEKVVGAAAKLHFDTDDGDRLRTVFGVIAECADNFDIEGDAHSYRLILVPRFWRSALVEILDIFIDMTVPEIIEHKLEQTGLGVGQDVEFRLNESHLKKEFVVQYKETDLRFISRLCEHYGLAYFFEHDQGRDVVVFSDGNHGFGKLAPNGDAQFRKRGEKLDVFDLRANTRMMPRNFVQRDYNYRTPTLDVTGSNEVETGHVGAVYEFGGHFKTTDEAENFAIIRSQERLCASRPYTGASALPRMTVGVTVDIQGHPLGDQPLFITEVEHVGSQGFRADDQTNYSNTFRALHQDLVYRPQRCTAKPVVHGVMTGIVEAEEGSDYADIDDQGRYRVRFVFDTALEGERQASRPIRMMQPHAGAGYGMHFPLHGGIEVIIAFVGGDPDRPIIAGTVPNPASTSPVQSENRERNVVRTRGGNEINIDDTVDGQRIKLMTPHSGTSFQLGSPNDPVDGASLRTGGMSSTTATEGSARWSAWGGHFSAAVDLLGSGNIVASAGSPTLLDMAAAGASAAEQVYGWIANLTNAERHKLLAEEAALIETAETKSRAVKDKEKECQLCRLKAKEALPTLADDASDDQKAKHQAVLDAMAAYEDAERANDDQYLTVIGTMEDRNGIIDAQREGFTNPNFEPVMERDTDAEIGAYDTAAYETKKAELIAERWEEMSDEDKEGLTEESYTADELAKVKVDPPAPGEDEHWDAMTQAQWAADGNDPDDTAGYEAWVADQTPVGTKALQDWRKEQLDAAVAAAGDDYDDFEDAMAACCDADTGSCGAALHTARQEAIYACDAYAIKMAENTPRLHELQQDDNNNNQYITTHVATGINALLTLWSLVELYSARSSVIDRWKYADKLATGVTFKEDMADITKAYKEIKKWAIPFIRPQNLHSLGSDNSLELFGERDAMLWSETTTIFGCGTKDAKWWHTLGAGVNFLTGMPLPGPPPDPEKGRVNILAGEAIRLATPGTIQSRCTENYVVSTQGDVNLWGHGARSSEPAAGLYANGMAAGMYSFPKAPTDEGLFADATAPQNSFLSSVSVSLNSITAYASADAQNADAAVRFWCRDATGPKAWWHMTDSATQELMAEGWGLAADSAAKTLTVGGDTGTFLKFEEKKADLCGKFVAEETKSSVVGEAVEITATDKDVTISAGKAVFGATEIQADNLLVKGAVNTKIAAVKAQLTTAVTNAKKEAKANLKKAEDRIAELEAEVADLTRGNTT